MMSKRPFLCHAAVCLLLTSLQLSVQVLRTQWTDHRTGSDISMYSWVSDHASSAISRITGGTAEAAR